MAELVPHTDKLRIRVVFLGSMRGILREITNERDFSQCDGKRSGQTSCQRLFFDRLNFIQGEQKTAQTDIFLM